VGDGDPDVGRFILDGKAASAMNPEDKAKAFIASFDGGECFLIEPLPGATKPHEYQAVGRTIEPFRRLDSACKRGRRRDEPHNIADHRGAMSRPRSRPACRRTATAARLRLQNYQVGQPLLETISGLERRRLYLVLVDNDGLAHRLETKVDPNGDSAAFSVR
jgi:hypothetical protein